MRSSLIRSAVNGVVTIGLADVPNTGQADGLFKIRRDGQGRISGAASASTDDLPEGKRNLYRTQERAPDAVGASIEASDEIIVTDDLVKRKLKADLTLETKAKWTLAETALQPKTDLGSVAIFTLKDVMLGECRWLNIALGTW